MARKFFLVTAAVIAVLMTTTTFAQQCGGPVPVLSVYTTLDRQAGFGIGTELGSMRDDSPWGYFGGVIFTTKKSGSGKMLPSAKDTTLPYDLTIYMKGSYRIFQSNWSSLHAVSSAEINTKSQFDLKTGVRFLLPVSDKVALSAEPVISVRTQNISGRIGFAVAF